MEINIKGTPKEIANLVVEVQNRQDTIIIKPLKVMSDAFKEANLDLTMNGKNANKRHWI